MNEQQKYLLDTCGYEYLDGLGCIRQDERKDRIFMTYNMKSKRFVLAIPKSELMTERDLRKFQREFDEKFILVYTLNRMGKSND